MLGLGLGLVLGLGLGLWLGLAFKPSSPIVCVPVLSSFLLERFKHNGDWSYK